MLAFAFVVTRAKNLFEKADNFGCIELDFHGASPFVEVSLGNPLEREKTPFLSSGLKNLHKIFYTTLDNLCFRNIMAANSKSMSRQVRVVFRGKRHNPNAKQQ